jgi:2-methylcitrate dehydratase PrpD
MERVAIEVGPDDDPDYPVGAKADSVALDLADGTRIESEPVHRFRGHGQNPVSREELRAKFDDCVQPVAGRAMAVDLFEALQELERLPGVHALPVVEFEPT